MNTESLDNLQSSLYVPWLVMLLVTIAYALMVSTRIVTPSALGDSIAMAALALTLFRIGVVIYVNHKEDLASVSDKEMQTNSSKP